MKLEQVKIKLDTIVDFEDAEVIEAIAGGLSGAHVFKVKNSSGKHFVLKFEQVNEAAVKGQQRASQFNLAPAIIYFDTECVLMEELVAKPMPEVSERLELLSQFLRSLHAVEPEGFAQLNPYQVLEANLRQVMESTLLTSTDKEKLKVIVAKKLHWQSAAKVFTHNDLNPGNMVYGAQGLQAVDWASAGLNDAYFDLATISNWYFFGDELLETYLERLPTANELAHFHAMQALTKALVSTSLLLHAMTMGVEHELLPDRKNLPSLRKFQSMLHTGEVQLNNGLSIYQFAILILDSIE